MTDNREHVATLLKIASVRILSMDEAATIRAHIEGLEADARRYRWLRDDAPDAWDVSQWIDTDTQAIHMQDDLDAAIDSAMQENRDG